MASGRARNTIGKHALRRRLLLLAELIDLLEQIVSTVIHKELRQVAIQGRRSGRQHWWHQVGIRSGGILLTA